MMRDFEPIRSKLGKGTFHLFLHSNADLDCVGSSVALGLHFGKFTISAPAGISHLGKRLLSSLGIEALDEVTFAPEDTIVVLDAQDDSSIGYSGVDWRRAIVIDHHREKGQCGADISFIDETATSCAELVWEIISPQETLDRRIALCLMTGIVADTGHLKRGSHRTFKTVAEILEVSGLTMDEVMPMFEAADDQDMSRRMSRLKGAQRMKFERVGEWIVAASEIGAFESAACQALLSTGADVAFAGSQNNDDFRITGRANRMATNAGIHLGEIMNRIALESGGEGGGHDGAAGLSGQGNIEAMLDICLHNTIATLKGQPRRKIAHEENVL